MGGCSVREYEVAVLFELNCLTALKVGVLVRMFLLILIRLFDHFKNQCKRCLSVISNDVPEKCYM